MKKITIIFLFSLLVFAPVVFPVQSSAQVAGVDQQRLRDLLSTLREILSDLLVTIRERQSQFGSGSAGGNLGGGSSGGSSSGSGAGSAGQLGSQGGFGGFGDIFGSLGSIGDLLGGLTGGGSGGGLGSSGAGGCSGGACGGTAGNTPNNFGGPIQQVVKCDCEQGKDKAMIVVQNIVGNTPSTGGAGFGSASLSLSPVFSQAGGGQQMKLVVDVTMLAAAQMTNLTSSSQLKANTNVTGLYAPGQATCKIKTGSDNQCTDICQGGQCLNVAKINISGSAPSLGGTGTSNSSGGSNTSGSDLDQAVLDVLNGTGFGGGCPNGDCNQR